MDDKYGLDMNEYLTRLQRAIFSKDEETQSEKKKTEIKRTLIKRFERKAMIKAIKTHKEKSIAMSADEWMWFANKLMDTISDLFWLFDQVFGFLPINSMEGEE